MVHLNICDHLNRWSIYQNKSWSNITAGWFRWKFNLSLLNRATIPVNKQDCCSIVVPITDSHLIQIITDSHLFCGNELFWVTTGLIKIIIGSFWVFRCFLHQRNPKLPAAVKRDKWLLTNSPTLTWTNEQEKVLMQVVNISEEEFHKGLTTAASDEVKQKETNDFEHQL